VETTEALGVPVTAKEAMAFAFLSLETLAGRPGNVPSATGARRPVLLGSVTPPPAEGGGP
jgi:anhydro-N-acetylmuramic acid kinase